MTLFIRRIIVLATLLLSKGSGDPFEESVITCRVWFGDLDSWIYTIFLIPQMLLMALRPSKAAAIWKKRPAMTHPVYTELETIGFMSLLIRNRKKGDVVNHTRDGLRWVLGGINIKYLHGIRLFQKFRIRTRLVWWDDMWVYYETKFEYGDMLMCTMMRKALVANWSGPIPMGEILKKSGISPTPPPLGPELQPVLDALV